MRSTREIELKSSLDSQHLTLNTRFGSPSLFTAPLRAGLGLCIFQLFPFRHRSNAFEPCFLDFWYSTFWLIECSGLLTRWSIHLNPRVLRGTGLSVERSVSSLHLSPLPRCRLRLWSTTYLIAISNPSQSVSSRCSNVVAQSLSNNLPVRQSSSPSHPRIFILRVQSTVHASFNRIIPRQTRFDQSTNPSFADLNNLPRISKSSYSKRYNQEPRGGHKSGRLQ